MPAILEWPEVLKKSRVTGYPASVLDILPTVLEVSNVPYPDTKRPLDGVSLVPLLNGEIETRTKPIPFRHTGRAAWIDNNMKLLTNNIQKGSFALYDLAEDSAEQNDLAKKNPETFQKMRQQLLNWSRGVDASSMGKDYPTGKIDSGEPEPRFWTDVEEYSPYFDDWQKRWEYSSRLTKRKK